MTRYSTEFKVTVVKAFLNGEGGLRYLAKKFNVARHSSIEQWVELVKEQGYMALHTSHRKSNYSIDFKLSVITYYQTHEVGVMKVAAKFKLSPSQVYSWYSKYKKEGIVGLRPKTKGRPSRDMNKQKNKRDLNKLTMTKEEQYKQEIADLKARLAYQEMELAIIKN